MKDDLIDYSKLKKLFTHETKVRVGDLNYGNHLAHDKLILILHDARVVFLNSHSLHEMNIGNNIALMIVKLNINYIMEAFLGDKLIITLFNGEIGGSSFDLIYKIENIENKEITNCVTKMVCVNTTTRKPTRIPTELNSIIGWKNENWK